MERHLDGSRRPVAARLIGRVSLAASLLVAASGAATAAGPFAGFAGTWEGAGSVAFKNGASERIRCRAQYETSSGDNVLTQQLRCASASYQFELNTEIRHSNGTISGSWVEAINAVKGNVSGEASEGRIRAFVRGEGVAASVAVTMGPDAQAVTMRPHDQRVAEVSIELRRK
jgi:hypothetical protein